MGPASLKKRLGDILVNVGLITNEQLNEALNIQMQKGGKLGSILAQMGVVNEEVLLSFLGKQCGISYVSLNEFGPIDRDVLRSVPENLVRLQSLIPIAKEGNRLTVAMSDPFNILAIDDIKLVTGYDLQVVIASESEIKAAIDRYYANTETLENIMKTQLSPSGGEDHADDAGNALYALLSNSLRNGASEIYLEPQDDHVRTRYRTKGILREQYRMKTETERAIARKLKTDLGLETRAIPQEGLLQTCVDGQVKDFHISFTPAAMGERIYLKSLSADPSLTDINRLGFEHEILSLFREGIDPRPGVVLITGPQKSGRTTTLLATLAYLNHPERDIVYIDNEPRNMNGITQAQVRPQEGLTFAQLTGAYMRQNPDVVACGDIADSDTAKLLFESALAGKCVFAAMTASGAIEALSRARNFGVGPALMAATLQMVVNQRLLRTICINCKESYEVPANLVSIMGIEAPAGKDTVTLYRGRGCPRCDGSGYGGVTAVFEMLRITPALREILAKDSLEARMNAVEMVSLKQELWKKVTAGATTAEEFLRLMKM